MASPVRDPELLALTAVVAEQAVTLTLLASTPVGHADMLK